MIVDNDDDDGDVIPDIDNEDVIPDGDNEDVIPDSDNEFENKEEYDIGSYVIVEYEMEYFH